MEKILGRVCETEEGKRIKIDVKDRKILTLLSQDSRTPLTQIAHQVQLSRDAINYRIKRLEKLGVILRFFPMVSLKKFGYYKYHVFLQIDESKAEKYAEFMQYLKNHPNVKNIIEYSDRWDIEIVFVAKTVRDFDNILVDLMSKYPELIMEREKLIVIKAYITRELPQKFMDKKVPAPTFREEEEAKLDEKDLMILEELCRDCRESSYKIAERVKLSADGVGYRIKKMVESGIIKQFTILVNLSYLRYDWYTFAVNVKTFDSAAEAKFLQFCSQHPFIIKAEKVLGTWDFLLYIATDSPRNFHQTIKDIKYTFADITKDYTAYNAFVEHFFTPIPKVIFNSYIKKPHEAKKEG